LNKQPAFAHLEESDCLVMKKVSQRVMPRETELLTERRENILKKGSGSIFS